MLMLGTYINLGSDFATTSLTYAGTLVGDLSTYLALMVGVGLTVMVVVALVRSFMK